MNDDLRQIVDFSSIEALPREEQLEIAENFRKAAAIIESPSFSGGKVKRKKSLGMPLSLKKRMSLN